MNVIRDCVRNADAGKNHASRFTFYSLKTAKPPPF